MQRLSRLVVIQSSIASIGGVELLKCLEYLQVCYCSRLTDISALARCSSPIAEVWFERCKKMMHHEVLSSLSQLRKLLMIDCGKLSSIGFIRQMRQLEFISFARTNVLDGDIAPCIGLAFVGFDNKRHYSHKLGEIQRITRDRDRPNT
jgi:hypothetical protein